MVSVPELVSPIHPGEILLEEFLKPLGISQALLATTIGVSYVRLNEIVNGRRSLTADTALRLARALGTSPELWLNPQRSWDLWGAISHHIPVRRLPFPCNRLGPAVALAALALLVVPTRSPAQARSVDWPVYGGSDDHGHYTTLGQISPANVKRLEVAWTYETHDEFAGSEMQANPIVVDGVLYATSPKLHVFALNAATGREL